MKTLYLFAMRYASAALIIIGLLAAACQLIVGLEVVDMMGEGLKNIGRDDSYANPLLSAYARAISPALSELVWPLLGAAALWRADRWLGRSTPREASE